MIHAVGKQVNLSEMVAGDFGLVDYDGKVALVLGLADQTKREAYVLFGEPEANQGRPMMGVRIPERSFSHWEDILVLHDAIISPVMDSLTFTSERTDGCVVSTPDGNFLRVRDHQDLGESFLIGEGGAINWARSPRNRVWVFRRWNVLIPSTEQGETMIPVFSFSAP